jgi:hypothetical protein
MKKTRGLADHPVIVILGLIASCLAIFTFVTGFQTIWQIFANFNSTVQPTNSISSTAAATDFILPTAWTATTISFPTDTPALSPTDTTFATDTPWPTDTALPPTAPPPPPTEVIHLPDPTLVISVKAASLFCSKVILCGPRFEEGTSFHAQYSIVEGNPYNTEFDILGFHSYKYVVEGQGYFEDVIPIDQWNAGPLKIWMINCNAEPVTVEFSLSGGAWNRCE